MRSNFGYIFLFLFFLNSLNLHSQSLVDEDSDVQSRWVIRKEFKDKLSEKYTGKDFNYEETLKTNEPNFWERFKMWLARKIQDLFRFTQPERALKVTVWMFRIVGFSLILFVIYKIAMAFINEEGHWVFGRKSDKIDIIAKDLEQNLLQIDFETLIKEAIQKKQYRLAIRYYYLLTLKKLTQNNIIDWHYEKTNLDYYREIENATLKSQFKYVSYLYDYCWYGDFDLNEQEFKMGEKSFRNFFNTL